MISIPAKSEEWKPLENVVPLVVEEKVDTPQENGEYHGVHEKTSVGHKSAKSSTVERGGWFGGFRHGFHRYSFLKVFFGTQTIHSLYVFTKLFNF
jgi:hypothetical protein